MVDEKRFPPPGNEVGYREPAPPAARAPEPTAAEPVARRHVVASRPDEPDLALQKAATEDIARKQEERLARDEAWRRKMRPIIILVYVAGAVIWTIVRLGRC